MSTPPPRRWSAKVVGVTFVSNYPDNLQMLESGWNVLTGGADQVLPAALVRRPDHDVDPNAVEVHAVEVRLGYLPAQVAKRLAPHLDAGVVYDVEIDQVNIHPDHPHQPGIRVSARLPALAKQRQASPAVSPRRAAAIDVIAAKYPKPTTPRRAQV